MSEVVYLERFDEFAALVVIEILVLISEIASTFAHI